MNIFFSVIGTILVWAGAILVFDARPITKKLFSFGDQNEASMGFKFFGTIFSLISRKKIGDKEKSSSPKFISPNTV